MNFDVALVGSIYLTISIVILFLPKIFKFINSDWGIEIINYNSVPKIFKIFIILCAFGLFILGIVVSYIFNSRHESVISKQDSGYLNDENRMDLTTVQIQSNYLQNYEIVEKPVLNVDTDSFKITNQVRLKGMDEWYKEINAKKGDVVEFQIEYKNNSEQAVRDVMLIDSLPDGMIYIKDSTKLKNANHPQWVNITSDNISSIVDKGINIGAYTYGSNAFVIFEAQVIDSEYKYNGFNLIKMTNWTKITSGDDTKISFSKVFVPIQ